MKLYLIIILLSSFVILDNTRRSLILGGGKLNNEAFLSFENSTSYICKASFSSKEGMKILSIAKDSALIIRDIDLNYNFYEFIPFECSGIIKLSDVNINFKKNPEIGSIISLVKSKENAKDDYGGGKVSLLNCLIENVRIVESMGSLIRSGNFEEEIMKGCTLVNITKAEKSGKEEEIEGRVRDCCVMNTYVKKCEDWIYGRIVSGLSYKCEGNFNCVNNTFEECFREKTPLLYLNIESNIKKEYLTNKKNIIKKTKDQNEGKECYDETGDLVICSGETINIHNRFVMERNYSFINCYFNKCISETNGGAIVTSQSNIYHLFCVSFEGCVFEGCIANDKHGGAIRTAAMGFVIIDNCKFFSCMTTHNSGFGGGICIDDTYHCFLLRHTDFHSCSSRLFAGAAYINVAKMDGGGIPSEGKKVGCAERVADSMVYNCIVESNYANYFFGGLEFFPSSPQQVRNCFFGNNTAKGSRGGGLGVDFIAVKDQSTPFLYFLLFVNNSAVDHGKDVFIVILNSFDLTISPFLDCYTTGEGEHRVTIRDVSYDDWLMKINLTHISSEGADNEICGIIYPPIIYPDKNNTSFTSTEYSLSSSLSSSNSSSLSSSNSSSLSSSNSSSFSSSLFSGKNGKEDDDLKGYPYSSACLTVDEGIDKLEGKEMKGMIIEEMVLMKKKIKVNNFRLEMFGRSKEGNGIKITNELENDEDGSVFGVNGGELGVRFLIISIERDLLSSHLFEIEKKEDILKLINDTICSYLDKNGNPSVSLSSSLFDLSHGNISFDSVIFNYISLKNEGLIVIKKEERIINNEESEESDLTLNIINCLFNNIKREDGNGGGIEMKIEEGLDVCICDCTFIQCSTNNGKGGGGYIETVSDNDKFKFGNNIFISCFGLEGECFYLKIDNSHKDYLTRERWTDIIKEYKKDDESKYFIEYEEEGYYFVSSLLHILYPLNTDSTYTYICIGGNDEGLDRDNCGWFDSPCHTLHHSLILKKNDNNVNVNISVNGITSGIENININKNIVIYGRSKEDTFYEIGNEFDDSSSVGVFCVGEGSFTLFNWSIIITKKEMNEEIIKTESKNSKLLLFNLTIIKEWCNYSNSIMILNYGNINITNVNINNFEIQQHPLIYISSAPFIPPSPSLESETELVNSDNSEISSSSSELSNDDSSEDHNLIVNINNCLFSNVKREIGEGGTIQTILSQFDILNIHNCSFVLSHSNNGRGGGIFAKLSKYDQLSLSGCKFSSCYAVKGSNIFILSPDLNETVKFLFSEKESVLNEEVKDNNEFDGCSVVGEEEVCEDVNFSDILSERKDESGQKSTSYTLLIAAIIVAIIIIISSVVVAVVVCVCNRSEGYQRDPDALPDQKEVEMTSKL